MPKTEAQYDELRKISDELSILKSRIDSIISGSEAPEEEMEDMEDEEEMGEMEDEEEGTDLGAMTEEKVGEYGKNRKSEDEKAKKPSKKKIDLMIAFLGKKGKKEKE